MTLATKPFDPAEYLATAESQAYLLEDALESGDTAYLADALGIIARARGMTDTAAKAVSRRKRPTQDRLLFTVWRPKGYLYSGTTRTPIGLNRPQRDARRPVTCESPRSVRRASS